MKKILFVGLDEFSNINSSLENQLRKHFHDYAMEFLILKPRLKKNIIVLFISVLAVFKEYFFDFIKGNKSIVSFRQYLYHTPYIMKYFNREVQNKLINNTYSFVFQTQSVFDSSSKHTPNFIYIDHTNLNNLNYEYINPSQYLCSSAYIQEEKKIYTNATLLFVMSENMKSSLITQYGVNHNKVKLVYAGSNTKIIEQVNQKKYSNKNILFVGKDWERKGGKVLVEAFKLVQKTVPDATLTIIGCNPSLSIKNCTIVGEIPIYKIAEYYNSASVFCLPTKREPFGIVFIEAMLNSLPIVTNTVGATPELVFNDENGYRLNNKPKEFAEALISLLTDPVKCEQFGKRSYQIANDTYRWDNVGNQFAKHIVESLNINMNKS